MGVATFYALPPFAHGFTVHFKGVLQTLHLDSRVIQITHQYLELNIFPILGHDMQKFHAVIDINQSIAVPAAPAMRAAQAPLCMLSPVP